MYGHCIRKNRYHERGVWGLYRDQYRDSLAHSSVSTSKNRKAALEAQEGRDHELQASLVCAFSPGRWDPRCWPNIFFWCGCEFLLGG